MTTPQDPFGPPGDPSQQPGGSGQPGYGPPPGSDQPPAWGAPAGPPSGDGAPQGYGPPQGYVAPQGYGAPGGYGAPPQGWGQPQKPGTNGLAIASLVTAFLCSVVGVVLGFIAKSQIKKTGQAGNGLATAGIVIGILNMLLGLLVVGAGGFSTSP